MFTSPTLKRTLVVLCVITAIARITAAPSEAELRQYVTDCVADPKIFVLNPPAELRAYADLSPKELEERQRKVIKDGAIMFLYPNGLPAKIETKIDFKNNGLSRTWYRSGALQTDEYFEKEKLVRGQYFTPEGKLIAEIKDGTGKRIEFELFDPGNGDAISKETSYVDGLKDGIELTYVQKPERKVWMETSYRKGLKNGLEKCWGPSGQLNTSTHYVDGKEDGEQTYWFANGKVQSVSHYKNGQQIGDSSRYYESGQKQDEFKRDGVNIQTELRWYPEGALLVEKRYDPVTHRVAEAESFDRDGTKNGEVRGGTGTLVVLDTDSLSVPETFKLEIYDKENGRTERPLPNLRWTSGGGRESAATLKLSAYEVPNFQEIKSRIIPLAGANPAELIEVTINLREGQQIPVKIPTPVPFERWVGTIYCQTTAIGSSGTYRFTQALYDQKARNAAPPAADVPKKDPIPRAMYLSTRGRSKDAPKVEGITVPDLSEAAGGYTLDERGWVLYRNPPVLIYLPRKATTWQLLQTFDFQPEGMAMLRGHQIIVWGIKPTETPEKGIPYVVKISEDEGKTFTDLSVPKVDFIFQMSAMEGILVIKAANLPNSDQDAGKDWFELPTTHFISDDAGRHFTEQKGLSFLSIGQVTGKSVAPDGKRRAYSLDSSFRGTSVSIYLAHGLSEIPKPVLTVGVRPEIVWSPNSQILALRYEGKLIAYYDVRTQQSEVADPSAHARGEELTSKQVSALNAMDEKIRGILAQEK